MRTTLDIDDRLLAIARLRAQEQDISLGKAVSQLIERGLHPQSSIQVGESGFPVFVAPPDAPVITMELINELRDGDDLDR